MQGHIILITYVIRSCTAHLVTCPMSSSSSPSVSAKDNRIDKNNEHTTNVPSQHSLSMACGQQLNYQSVAEKTHLPCIDPNSKTASDKPRMRPGHKFAGLTDHLPPGVNLNSNTPPDEPCMPCGHKSNARNLIVCIDGTSNQFGEKVSVRLANICPGSRCFQRSEHKRN